MAQSLFKNHKKTLRRTKALYHKFGDTPNTQTLKALEFQTKLHALIHQSQDQDPIERLKQLDINDVPLEALQKWITQMSASTQH
ncbi:MAG: hypothetical protein ACK4V2_03775 [Pseudomonadota bacterium]|jgi:hypothetical protein|nr:hypothetical protein [Alphaproteobacteria bacterium]